MARYQATVPSPMSVEEAFDFLAAFQNIARWDPSVVEAQPLDEEVAVGARFALEARSLGRRLPLEYRITELVRPRRVVLEADAATFRSIDTITVDPDPDGVSRVTYDAHIRMRGVLKVADPAMQLVLRRLGDRAAAGLERAVGRSTPSARAQPLD